MKNTIVVGLVDYENLGKTVNKVEIEYSFDGISFTASGTIWDAKQKNCLHAGLILDEILELFPEHDLVKRIHKVWSQWSLSDSCAGSPRQEEFLMNKNITQYEEAVLALTEAGLEPDSEYLYENKPYAYGSSLLQKKIPQAVADEILSWA